MYNVHVYVHLVVSDKSWVLLNTLSTLMLIHKERHTATNDLHVYSNNFTKCNMPMYTVHAMYMHMDIYL